MARRIGFVSIPLACLVIRVAMQTLHMLGYVGRDVYEDEVGGTMNTHVDVPVIIPSPPEWVREFGIDWVWGTGWAVIAWVSDTGVQNRWMENLRSVAGWVVVLGCVFIW